MSLRFTIGLCAIIVGAFSLTSCQPPRPRIAQAEAPAPAIVTASDTMTKGVLAAFDSTEQAIQIRNLDGSLSNSSKRSR